MTRSRTEMKQLAINTIRTLSIDAIEKAKSGHPGLPMGAAPMAYVLWHSHLNVCPSAPKWENRDRFILSAGHGSMLLYSLLHLAGFKVSIEDIKNFRQWGSKTPGHPEFGITDGVETTTGPLGQGAANAVGMAIAERMLAHRFNKPGFEIVDHRTFVLCGDGDLMEGISSEAASLAGHLKLGKLICLYDSNDISLDGPTTMAFTEDIKKRYESYGWQVITVADGNNDILAIERAIKKAKAETLKPSLIIVKTTIGYGAPNKCGKSDAHGAPLGTEEAKLAKAALGFNPDEKFVVPAEVRRHFKKMIKRGTAVYEKWFALFTEYSKTYPDLAVKWNEAADMTVAADWHEGMPVFKPGDQIATRKASGMALNHIATKIGYIAGGDADMSCSTQTYLQGKGDFNGITGEGRNIHFGVREHAMGAIANGMAYHGGIRPFTATFFSFVDYMRPTLRMASLSSLPVVFIFTHDSITVGEDGPTHQPIEQLMSLRSMPGMTVIRPSDATETVEAWKYIAEAKTPVALILTRQNVPVIDRVKYAPASGLQKGAYIIAGSDDPEILIIATGSEVGISLEAFAELSAKGVKARVVSMPSWEIFEKQPAEYRETIIPPSIKKRISVEAGTTFAWCRYTGEKGIRIGINRFGESAPGDVMMQKFGFTSANIVEKALTLI